MSRVEWEEENCKYTCGFSKADRELQFIHYTKLTLVQFTQHEAIHLRSVPSVIWYGLLVSLVPVSQADSLLNSSVNASTRTEQLSVALSFLFGMSGKTGGWSDHLKAQHCPNAAFCFGVVVPVNSAAQITPL